MFFPEYETRLRAVEALRNSATDPLNEANLLETSAEVQRVAGRLPATTSGAAFASWGELLRAVGHLKRWGEAVRGAEMDADRHLRAAKQRAHDVLRRGVSGPAGSAIEAVARKLMEVQEPDEVESVAANLLSTRLPLPFPGTAQAAAPEWGAPSTPEDTAPVVAFLQFFIGPDSLGEPQDLRANVLYDLRVEVRLSQWPGEAEAIELAPFSVEPEGTIDAPTFIIKGDSQTLTFSCTGRLRVRVAHDALARPLEVSYGARVIPVLKDQGSSTTLKVQGQGRLLLRCEEHAHLWRGNRAIKESIDRVRLEARRHGLPDDEISSFLTLLGGVAFVASDALASNVFRGDRSEEEFQAEMRTRLRANHSIGPNLEEHAHIGGGITDLSFDRVRLELKVDPRTLDLEGAFVAYGQQLAQYATGSDRRCGVLGVLCRTADNLAPGSLENDIGVRVVPPPTGGDRGVLLGIVLLRGDLSKPSTLSRRS